MTGRQRRLYAPRLLAGLAIASLTACTYLDDGSNDPSSQEEVIVNEIEVAATTAKVTIPGSAVTASANDGNVPANTVDGSLTTRWAANGDGQWIRYDLGTTRTVSHIRVAPYNGANRVFTFDIQRSSDGSSWTTISAGVKTALNNNLQTFDFTDVSTRYVRLVGHMNTGNTWNSYTEVEIWAVTDGGGSGGSGGGGSGGSGGSGGNSKFAISGSAVTASANDGNVPANTVDGNLLTRWSANGDGQWIRYDLGSNRRVSHVRIATYSGASRVATFDLQVSTDGSSWSTVASGLKNALNANLQTFDFTDRDPVRYVRIVGHMNSVNTWNSFTEVEIWGGSSGGGGGGGSGGSGGSGRQWRQRAAVAAVAGGFGGAPAGSPVSQNGQLKVCGTKLCNQNGKQIQLRGMSSHGIQWYPFGDCINANSLTWLVGDWGIDVLRMSMYIQEDGYETDPTYFKSQIDKFVAEVLKRGIYGIMDWHMLSPGDPHYNLTRAKEFFTWFTSKYGTKPNFLYEVANEPSGVTWSRIKSYHEQIIPTVRAGAPNGVVLLGTRAWSSFGVSDGAGPSEVINSPVNATNVMYVFHFYAKSHRESYLNALKTAAASLPVFVTEFGTQESSGGGSNDFTMAQQYIDFMRTAKISWVNWNFSDDPLSGAALIGGKCPNGPWAVESLKPAGAWIRQRIQSPADAF